MFSAGMRQGIASVTDNFHKPGTPIVTTEAWEKSQGAQTGFLDHILRLLRRSHLTESYVQQMFSMF